MIKFRFFFITVVFLFCEAIFAYSPYFEISDIEVKQTARDSLSAKQAALSISLRKAFAEMLATEFRDAKINLHGISEKRLQKCIFDYSIEYEKTSDSVYIGRFTYRFSKKEVVDFLRERGIKVDAKKILAQDIKIAVWRNDFIKIKLGANPQVRVLEFDRDRVVFSTNEKILEKIKELGIRHAKL